MTWNFKTTEKKTWKKKLPNIDLGNDFGINSQSTSNKTKSSNGLMGLH